MAAPISLFQAFLAFEEEADLDGLLALLGIAPDSAGTACRSWFEASFEDPAQAPRVADAALVKGRALCGLRLAWLGLERGGARLRAALAPLRAAGWRVGAVPDVFEGPLLWPPAGVAGEAAVEPLQLTFLWAVLQQAASFLLGDPRRIRDGAVGLYRHRLQGSILVLSEKPVAARLVAWSAHARLALISPRAPRTAPAGVVWRGRGFDEALLDEARLVVIDDWPLDEAERIAALCRSRGVPVHLRGSWALSDYPLVEQEVGGLPVVPAAALVRAERRARARTALATLPRLRDRMVVLLNRAATLGADAGRRPLSSEEVCEVLCSASPAGAAALDPEQPEAHVAHAANQNRVTLFRALERIQDQLVAGAAGLAERVEAERSTPPEARWMAGLPAGGSGREVRRRQALGSLCRLWGVEPGALEDAGSGPLKGREAACWRALLAHPPRLSERWEGLFGTGPAGRLELMLFALRYLVAPHRSERPGFETLGRGLAAALDPGGSEGTRERAGRALALVQRTLRRLVDETEAAPRPPGRSRRRSGARLHADRGGAVAMYRSAVGGPDDPWLGSLLRPEGARGPDREERGRALLSVLAAAPRRRGARVPLAAEPQAPGWRRWLLPRATPALRPLGALLGSHSRGTRLGLWLPAPADPSGLRPLVIRERGVESEVIYPRSVERWAVLARFPERDGGFEIGVTLGEAGPCRYTVVLVPLEMVVDWEAPSPERWAGIRQAAESGALSLHSLWLEVEASDTDG